MNPSSKPEKHHHRKGGDRGGGGDVSYVGVTSKSNNPTPQGSVAASPVPHTPRATPVHYDYDSQSLCSMDTPGPFEMSHGGRTPVVHLGLISTPTHTPVVPHVTHSSLISTPVSHHSSNQHQAEKLWDQRPVSYPPAPQHNMGMDNDWDAREEIRQRELDEARARAAQMEKTMRWWSDCTANWREKWSKVRNERNKAREDCRHLRLKLEAALNEIGAVKREKSELESKIGELKHQIQIVPAEQDIDTDNSRTTAEQEKTVQEACSETQASNTELSQSEIDENKVTNSAVDSVDNIDAVSSASNLSQGKDDLIIDNTLLVEQKIAAVSLKLDEAQKTIKAERDEKTQITKQMDELQRELSTMKIKYDDLKLSNQDNLLELTKLRDEHEHELGRMTQELEDETCSRFNMDKTLSDLRKELERLQAENAAEWGKRERLETEKIALERENKKLRHSISEMEENLGKRNKMTLMDNDMKIIQQDLHDKNKELSDLKHSHNKCKKLLQERTTELEHARRRAEQYEIDVKKLRARIEELRKDLANAEDEVDNQTNNARRIQRSNDELQEQLEGIQVQFEHAKSRLRRAEGNLPRSSSMKSFDMIDIEVSGTEPETDEEQI